jgi:beta-glucosidase
MKSFPEQFVFGAATSAYQIEGAVQEGGRGLSIWDVFSHTPGNVKNGDTGDTACDHYHRYREDVQLMRQLGLQSYRFSIAWPRLFPSGRGAVNEAGLDFYKRLIDALLDAGIEPMVTLYHWDLPQALQEAFGGWTSRDTAKAFADYADVVFHRLGDVVPKFITVNEPWCSAVLGHAFGQHAPGVQRLRAAVQAAHHLLLAHGLALEAFRDAALHHASIGITNIVCDNVPASDRPADIAATQRMDALLNRWFLDALLRGRYPDALEPFGVAAVIQPGDFAKIAAPVDFLGVNYYQCNVTQANPSDPLLGAAIVPPQGEVTGTGWGVHPEGLYRVLKRIHREYGAMAMYVTENGAAYEDVVDAGEIHDHHRIRYLARHLDAVRRAIEEGVDVRGYYVWSLLDNFEWAEGYTPRFGITYVDYATQARMLKDSAKWYQTVITERSLASSAAAGDLDDRHGESLEAGS